MKRWIAPAAWLLVVARAAVLGGSMLGLPAAAQTAPQPAKPAASKKAPAPAAAARAAKPAASAAAPALPSGKGWRSGAAVPAWVVEPPPAPPGTVPAPNAGGRREALYEVQSNYTLPKPQTFVRWRSVALDAAALGAVSQPQIHFNPAYQTVMLHGVAVWRDGRRIDRLAEVRVEAMRREQGLEQQVINGSETLLVVVSDVRVGEPVEVAYTVEGENPIFEGRISTGLRLGYEGPVDLLHYRLTAPAGRTLQTRLLRGVGGDVPIERSAEGNTQVLRVVRHQVAAVPLEANTPPWFKVHPAVLVSEYRDWADVDAWAQRLFAQPVPTHPAVAARAAAFRAQGLSGAALASEVLRFVQDEVRYFSASLGESSHRPKPPDKTLADLLGDCKDKVMLLNALLGELGFDAKPVLVSMARNRGLADFLPGHDELDHVITQLQLDGKRWLLDATMTGQGLALDTRGQFPYGSLLVVGSGALTALAEPADALNKLEFEQRWDLSKPGQPAQLVSTMRAHGLMAERWRGSVAAGGLQRVAEALASGMARMAPGIQAQGTPELKDDRQNNVLELTQRFTHADFGSYARGTLDAEYGAVELLDALVGPAEARRRTPFLLDQPRTVDSRIVVVAAQPAGFAAPALFEVNDRHFRYSARLEINGATLTATRRVERRLDQVAPGDVDSFRENVLRARGNLSQRIRLPLIDAKAVGPELERADKRLRDTRGWRNDTLAAIVGRAEIGRLFDGKVLAAMEPGSALAAQVLASRAQSSNMVGDFAAGLVDADAALAVKPQLEAAQEARGVALLGAGRVEDALAEFTRLAQGPGRVGTGTWLGSLSYQLGRYADAEKWLREAVDRGGEERDFALLWLYLAAEQQGGRGKAAIAPYLDGADSKRFSTALLQFLHGSIDREALFKKAREQAPMERLNLAEAYFYVGQQLAAKGQRDEALRWYARTVETGAVPYREVTFAQLELQRGKAAGR